MQILLEAGAFDRTDFPVELGAEAASDRTQHVEDDLVGGRYAVGGDPGYALRMKEEYTRVQREVLDVVAVAQSRKRVPPVRTKPLLERAVF